MAEIIVEQIEKPGALAEDIDAVGEKYSVKSMVKTMAQLMGIRRLVVSGVPLEVCYYGSKPVDWWFKDKFVEKDDLLLMMKGITHSHGPVTGQRRLTDFITDHKNTLGMNYINSTARYYK